MRGMDSSDPLDLFLPPVREWFRTTLGLPTPPQREGWPLIASGQNTLILAPTGSGKTLAAFLACLDHLWRQESLSRGVQVPYISPLKALNNDIARNLQLPLQGVAETARRIGWKLPVLEAAVRTGDTPSAERQRLIRKPPHVLITTPESLHLLLTSRARDTLRGVTHAGRVPPSPLRGAARRLEGLFRRHPREHLGRQRARLFDGVRRDHLGPGEDLDRDALAAGRVQLDHRLEPPPALADGEEVERRLLDPQHRAWAERADAAVCRDAFQFRRRRCCRRAAGAGLLQPGIGHARARSRAA